MAVLVRKIEARARPARVLIFDGPGVSVDPSTMALYAKRWEGSLGVSIRVAASEGGDPAAELLRAAEGIDVAVVNPGAADLVDVLPPEILTAFVGFSYPGTPAVRFDRGPIEDIAGRTLDGYRWALKYLLACCEWPLSIYRYGEERDQVAELRLPEGAGPHPVVVLIHGGAWKAMWRKDLMASMAVDFARRGLATWNVEFRRLGGGGGWPTTFDDLSSAIGALCDVAEEVGVDCARSVFIGHSSGGHLALWAAATGKTPLRPAGVVSLAGLSDLVEGARRRMFGGDNTAAELLGGLPEEVPERYASASPRALLPLGVPQTLVQGLEDHLQDLVDQNRVHARAADAAGDTVRLVEIEGATHMDLIEPTSPAWPIVAAEVERFLS
ncbi:MAG TPA: alpha/beta hydrolase [Gaiellaceae bacterium]|nr:alpha/beta hydrolase [Gaiellaceae bacterium]